MRKKVLLLIIVLQKVKLIGKLIPAGTGMNIYKNIKINTEIEKQEIPEQNLVS